MFADGKSGLAVCYEIDASSTNLTGSSPDEICCSATRKFFERSRILTVLPAA